MTNDKEKRNKEKREKYKDLEEKGLKFVYKVLTCDDERVCDECQKLEGTEYNYIDEVPKIPHTKCTNEVDGCRCLLTGTIA